jgi:hypothetical protein
MRADTHIGTATLAVRRPRPGWRRWLAARAVALRFWALEGDVVVLRRADDTGPSTAWPMQALGPQAEFLTGIAGDIAGTVAVAARPGRRVTGFAVSVERAGAVVCESHWRFDLRRGVLALDQIRSLPGNADLVPRLLANMMRFAKSRGARALQLTAALEAGAYVWARYGLVPRRPAWRRLRLELALRFALRTVALPARLVHRGWRLLANENPRAIAAVARLGARRGTGRTLLAGLHWRGRLDFTDAGAMRRFNRHLRARGIAPV